MCDGGDRGKNRKRRQCVMEGGARIEKGVCDEEGEGGKERGVYDGGRSVRYRKSVRRRKKGGEM